MTPIADLIQAMAAAGTPLEGIIAAVRTLEKQAAEKEEARRAKGRERVRKHRESRDVTLQSVTKQPVTSEASLREDIHPSSLRSEGSTPPETRATRKSKLPKDWRPTDADVEYATKRGFDRIGIDHEAEKFRLYYGSHGKAMQDWHLTWCNWIARAATGPPAHRRPLIAIDGGRRNGKPSRDDIFNEIAAERGLAPMGFDTRADPGGVEIIPPSEAERGRNTRGR